MDGAGTGSAGDAFDSGVVGADNADSGVGGVSVMSDAVGVGAGDAASGAVGGNAASFSFVPKTNSSIGLPSGLRFLVLISTLP